MGVFESLRFRYQPMTTSRLLGLNLRRLILLLSVLSALTMMANSIYAGYRVQRQQLIDATLQSNEAYATKLATSSEAFFDSAHQQLAYSAAIAATNFADQNHLLTEVKRLQLQTDSFNSVSLVGAEGHLLAIWPTVPGLAGLRLNTPHVSALNESKRAAISKPFTSATGNLVIYISHPIVAANGRYLGYVGGTIYLRQKNILQRLLGTHYYQDGSYLYAVDQDRKLLYHPDPARVGEVVHGNAIIEAVIRGKSGHGSVVNSKGVEMLTGYAYSPSTGWGIVAQRPIEATLRPLTDLTVGVMLKAALPAVLVLLIVLLLAHQISRPLRELANEARRMDTAGTSENISRIRAWYVEAAQLKRALLLGMGLLHNRIGKLNVDAQTDPMTGLHNRRGLESVLDAWRATTQPFAVISLDIDHFKTVNDTYGHATGDVVLQTMAQLMRSCCRDIDVVCRSGGEEFLILLPGTDMERACQVAERLRVLIEQTVIPCIQRPITASLGIAHWPTHATDIDDVIRLADAALYQAKNEGRNRVCTAAIVT
jgi:diguanylate cyclase (GGDEF)-like protein